MSESSKLPDKVTLAPSCSGIGCFALIILLILLFNVGGLTTAISSFIGRH